MIFDLRKSEIYRAVAFYRIFPANLLKFYRALLLILGTTPFVLAGINYVFETQVNIGLGWSLVVLPFAFSVMFFELFGNYYLKHPKIKSTNNIADLIEFEAAKVFDRAFELARGLGEKSLSTRTLFIALIEDNVVEKLFTRIIPSFRLIKKQLKESLDGPKLYSGPFSLFAVQEISPEITGLMEDATAIRDKHGSRFVSVLDILAALFDHNKEFKQFIISQD